MKATDILMDEHRVIEQVLNCLEKLAERCEVGGELDRDAALGALDFFRNFADRCHHGKEEGHLFPLLEARGLPREGGPTGVMLREHDEGRQLTAAMNASIQANAPGPFAQHARAYAGLLRQHIRKEDHCLFPMAAQVLSAGDAEALDRAFGNVESDEMGEGTHDRYLGLANELADKLGVPRACVASSGAQSCCHHH